MRHTHTHAMNHESYTCACTIHHTTSLTPHTTNTYTRTHATNTHTHARTHTHTQTYTGTSWSRVSPTARHHSSLARSCTHTNTRYPHPSPLTPPHRTAHTLTLTLTRRPNSSPLHLTLTPHLSSSPTQGRDLNGKPPNPDSDSER